MLYTLQAEETRNVPVFNFAQLSISAVVPRADPPISDVQDAVGAHSVAKWLRKHHLSFSMKICSVGLARVQYPANDLAQHDERDSVDIANAKLNVRWWFRGLKGTVA